VALLVMTSALTAPRQFRVRGLDRTLSGIAKLPKQSRHKVVFAAPLLITQGGAAISFVQLFSRCFTDTSGSNHDFNVCRNGLLPQPHFGRTNFRGGETFNGAVRPKQLVLPHSGEEEKEKHAQRFESIGATGESWTRKTR